MLRILKLPVIFIVPLPVYLSHMHFNLVTLDYGQISNNHNILRGSRSYLGQNGQTFQGYN